MRIRHVVPAPGGAALAWVIAASLVLLGCGSERSGRTDPGATDEEDRPDEGLLIEIAAEGGFRPVGAEFRSLPSAVVLADGTVFAPAAHTMEFPGPAVLPVSTGRLDPTETDRLLAAARDAGLSDDASIDLGEPPIADAATTVITVVADGEEHVTRVYALGVADGPTEDGPGSPGPGSPGPGEDGPAPVAPGLTEAQRAARAEIAEFVDLVSARVSSAADELYAPDRYRLLPLSPDQVLGAADGDERPWPVDVGLERRECVALTGSHAEEFAEVLPEATEATRWLTDDGDVVALVARALLPHEPDCPPGAVTGR